MYGTGLRKAELLSLRVKDIDFGSNNIFVRGGKGNKDRTTMLPQRLKPRLIQQIDNKNAGGNAGGRYKPSTIKAWYLAAFKRIGKARW